MGDEFASASRNRAIVEDSAPEGVREAAEAAARLMREAHWKRVRIDMNHLATHEQPFGSSDLIELRGHTTEEGQ